MSRIRAKPISIIKRNMLLFFVIALSFASCSQTQKTEPTALPVSLTEPAATLLPDHTVRVDDPDNFYLYSYRFTPYQDELNPRYATEGCFVPLRRQVGKVLDATSLRALLQSEDGYKRDLAFEMSVSNGEATLSLDPEQFVRNWIDYYVYYHDEEAIYTLWATLVMNCSEVERVKLLLGEESYHIQYEMQSVPKLNDDGYFIPVKLILPDYSMEELTELRNLVPYKEPVHLADFKPYHVYDGVEYPDMLTKSLPFFFREANALKITYFLNNTLIWNRVNKSFTCSEEADDQFVLSLALWSTPRVVWDTGWSDVVEYPQLLPLQQTSRTHAGKLKEHVEASARYLFGELMTFEHRSWRLDSYDAYSGVYWNNKATGFEDGKKMVLVAIDEHEDRFEIEAVYMEYQDYEGNFYDSSHKKMSYDEAAEYSLEQPRYRITLLKKDDGGFQFYSIILPEDAGS